jgi:asparagine synthase (glutamine-hydrolysing)
MAKLPANVKINKGIKKYILRETAKGKIPDSIRKAKRKFPSSMPITQWLILWKPEINQLLNSPDVEKSGYFQIDKIKMLYQRLLTGKIDPDEQAKIAGQIWRFINFELWLKHLSLNS